MKTSKNESSSTARGLPVGKQFHVFSIAKNLKPDSMLHKEVQRISFY